MSWSSGTVSIKRGGRRLVGLNVRGKTEPEIYQVSSDVFGIVGKMLSANEALGPYTASPRFEFSEVRFILRLLGVPSSFADYGTLGFVDLWISDELIAASRSHPAAAGEYDW